MTSSIGRATIPVHRRYPRLPSKHRETAMGLLDQILGRSAQGGRGMSPLTMLLLGVLAYRAYQGRGGGSGDIPRRGQPRGASPGNAGDPSPGGLGDLLRGGLGGLLAGGAAGGAAGGMFSGALRELVDRFQ